MSVYPIGETRASAWVCSIRSRVCSRARRSARQAMHLGRVEWRFDRIDVSTTTRRFASATSRCGHRIHTVEFTTSWNYDSPQSLAVLPIAACGIHSASLMHFRD
jgi:hypothetical protein